MSATTLAKLAALVVFVHGGTAAAQTPWRLISDNGGMRIEKRDVAGSTMPEVRVLAKSPLPVAQLAKAIWHERPGTPLQRRYPRTRVILREDALERLVYQRITAPVVRERDYTVLLRRNGDGTKGSFAVHFEIANQAGPPPVPGVVRLTILKGAWSVNQLPDGSSELVYWVHSEPGGSIPAFLARRPYIDSAKELVADVLQWAESHPG